MHFTQLTYLVGACYMVLHYDAQHFHEYLHNTPLGFGSCLSGIVYTQLLRQNHTQTILFCNAKYNASKLNVRFDLIGTN